MKNEFKYKKPEESLKKISNGDYFRGIVKIVRKTQPGPVILVVSDGYSSMEAVSKECEFNQGDIVELEGPVEKRAGKLQIEIKKINSSQKDFNVIIDKNSEPEEINLSIRSDKLTKLKPQIRRKEKKLLSSMSKKD